MNKGLNINISGGGTAIGNVSQGNGNSITASVSVGAMSNNLEKTHLSLSEHGSKEGLSNEEILNILHKFNELAAESSSPKPDEVKGKSTFSFIKDNAPWAYPIVKDFLTVAWPALAALI
jgi:hypothetical protein